MSRSDQSSLVEEVEGRTGSEGVAPRGIIIRRKAFSIVGSARVMDDVCGLRDREEMWRLDHLDRHAAIVVRKRGLRMKKRPFIDEKERRRLSIVRDPPTGIGSQMSQSPQ